MAKITYANKVALNENPEIADINKVTDDDMNEIKQVVNDNYDRYIEIQTTTPTDNDCKLFINPNESVNVYGNYISNSYGTSQEIGYSQEYVNKNLIYSTSEVDTGKRWIDGKKIYRIVVSFTTGSTLNSWQTENVAISNIDTILPNWVLDIKYSSYWYRVPNDIVKEIRISNSSSQLSIGYYMADSGFANANARAIVEYTKTD